MFQNVVPDFSSPQSALFPHQVISHGFFWVKATKDKKKNIDWQGFPLFGHPGTGMGERAILGIYPDKGIGVALLTNSKKTNREAAIQGFADVFVKALKGQGTDTGVFYGGEQIEFIRDDSGEVTGLVYALSKPIPKVVD